MAIHSSILPGKFHGQRNLDGYSQWGHKELDKTERLSTHTTFQWKYLETHYPIQIVDVHFTKAFSRHIILFQSKRRLLILKGRHHIKTGRMI